MDEMRIQSGFMQGIITKLIRKAVAKKLGVDLGIMFREPISIKFDGENANVNLSITAALSKEDLSKLLKDLV